MALIAASILDADFAHLRREIETVATAGVDMFTLDVMDGHFVPPITFGERVVARIRDWTDLPLETHLMVDQPAKWVEVMADAGADMITFHIEATDSAIAVIERIRKRDLRAGIALDVTTSVANLEGVLELVDLVNVMAVPAGYGGQAFRPETLGRIAEVRALALDSGTEIAIEVDGGVKFKNAAEVAAAGADILVVGTGIYHEADRGTAVRRLKAGVGKPQMVPRLYETLLEARQRSQERTPEAVDRLRKRRDDMGIPPARGR